MKLYQRLFILLLFPFITVSCKIKSEKKNNHKSIIKSEKENNHKSIIQGDFEIWDYYQTNKISVTTGFKTDNYQTKVVVKKDLREEVVFDMGQNDWTGLFLQVHWATPKSIYISKHCGSPCRVGYIIDLEKDTIQEYWYPLYSDSIKSIISYIDNQDENIYIENFISRKRCVVNLNWCEYSINPMAIFGTKVEKAKKEHSIIFSNDSCGTTVHKKIAIDSLILIEN